MAFKNKWLVHVKIPKYEKFKDMTMPETFVVLDDENDVVEYLNDLTGQHFSCLKEVIKYYNYSITDYYQDSNNWDHDFRLHIYKNFIVEEDVV